MPKLNQIIAISAGKKSSAQKAITEAHHSLQKTAQLEGISRTYKPKDDEGEQLPAEKKLVQVKAWDAVAGVTTALTELFDIVATQDRANCLAKANVVVDGNAILKEVAGADLEAHVVEGRERSEALGDRAHGDRHDEVSLRRAITRRAIRLARPMITSSDATAKAAWYSYSL